jgi:hypothetical protein
VTGLQRNINDKDFPARAGRLGGLPALAASAVRAAPKVAPARDCRQLQETLSFVPEGFGRAGPLSRGRR